MINGDSHPKSLWGVIGVCAVVAVTAAGAGWAIRGTYLADELEQIRRSKDWHLPENLEALGQLSKTVALQLQERRELEDARKRLPQLDAKLLTLSREATQLDQENKELRTRIKNSEGDTFEVTEGSSHFVVSNELAIGVNDVNTFGHSVTVQFGTKSALLHPGEPIETTLRGAVYTVTFVRLNGLAAVFTAHTQTLSEAPVAKKHS